MASLEDLLRISSALPADARDDGTLLVRWNVPGAFQLYLAPPDGDELVQLTDVADPVNGRFVPGSDRILVEFDEGGNERAQLYLHEGHAGSQLEPLLVEPEFLHVTPTFSPDGRLLAYACNRRNGRDLDVYVRSLADGDERCVFAPGAYCHVAGFSPDGRWLGVLRLTERTGDNDLHLVYVAGGEEPILVAPEEDDAVFGAPAWRADSQSFLFATSSERDVVGIARFELGSRQWVYVLEDEWDLDCLGDLAGRTLLVTANVDGVARADLYDLETLERRGGLELPDEGYLEAPVFSPRGGWLAYGFSSPRSTWDVWRVDTAATRTVRVTASPTRVAVDDLVRPTLHRYASFDGESIPYLLYEPPTEPPWPAVIEIHGGPEAQRRPMWMPLMQYGVSRGFAVVQPNVRGSLGYGKRFEHLDDGRLRLDAVKDIAALHDVLAADERIDGERVALYGGSYGGYMVLAGLAFEPERWAAGVAVVAISSLVTFLRNTSDYRRAFREREYGSLEHDLDFLLEVSPLTHVERVRAPLFLLHGANDPRVPLSEAEQLHAALVGRGVRCELHVYDDEGHGFQKLANRLDAYPKLMAFLEDVLLHAPALRR